MPPDPLDFRDFGVFSLGALVFIKLQYTYLFMYLVIIIIKEKNIIALFLSSIRLTLSVTMAVY